MLPNYKSAGTINNIAISFYYIRALIVSFTKLALWLRVQNVIATQLVLKSFYKIIILVILEKYSATLWIQGDEHQEINIRLVLMLLG